MQVWTSAGRVTKEPAVPAKQLLRTQSFQVFCAIESRGHNLVGNSSLRTLTVTITLLHLKTVYTGHSYTMDEDDSFLYGDSNTEEEVVKPPVQTTVPQPIPVEQTQPAPEDVVAQLELPAAVTTNGVVRESEEATPEEVEVEEEEEEESDDDVEIIMEPTARSLDFRNQAGRTSIGRTTSATFNTPSKAPQSQPSLTTEYTPRERGGVTKLSSTPQPSGATPIPAPSATPGSTQKTSECELQATDSGPDPSTLPLATAPPSHPSINPSIPGTLDGRSILEVDLNALAEKPWRRPGSDISDWFNYGFDEISWEAYCYRRREVGEVASVLKSNVLNFSGMPEEQLTALPPEIRTMVMAGATAMMASGGAGPSGPGMLPPGAGMNMNAGPMMGQMMNMNPMMNPMMHDMGMGVGGDMGMGVPGSGPGMMQDGGGPGGGPQGGGQNTPDQQVQMGMGVGEGFGPGGAPGQGMMGMGMGGEFGMQDPSMGQQMYPGMEGSSTPGQTPTPTRGVGAPGQFRGRGMPQGMGLRGRGGGFVGRGRALPVRPASPLPPNVPTGPRNKNKYKDIDGSAPAVDGLDYGGGGMKEGGRGTPDADERSNSRKRRSSPGLDEGRGSKRR